jgi:hypothetical protein
MNRFFNAKRPLFVALAGAALAGAAVLAPVPAKAWWVGPRIGIEIAPPVIVAPPPVVYAAPPTVYNYAYAPPPYYPQQPYYPPRHHFIPGHWEGPYWVPPHWV